MNVSAKKVLTAGVSIVTVGAIAVAPSVEPPGPKAPAVQLAAAVQPLTQQVDPITFVIDWAERIVIPPSLGAPIPTPPTVTIPAPTSIGSTITNVYNAVEPWVRYGFDLAAYAVGWIPYVGWLAPQITIFYNFGERIARSITYNIADWLDGKITFGQGLVNVGVDTFNSLVQLGIDQLNFWLPPLPPLPPFPFAAKQTPLTTAQLLTPAQQPSARATLRSNDTVDPAIQTSTQHTKPDAATVTTSATSKGVSRALSTGPQSRPGGTLGGPDVSSAVQSILATPAHANLWSVSPATGVPPGGKWVHRGNTPAAAQSVGSSKATGNNTNPISRKK